MPGSIIRMKQARAVGARVPGVPPDARQVRQDAWIREWARQAEELLKQSRRDRKAASRSHHRQSPALASGGLTSALEARLKRASSRGTSSRGSERNERRPRPASPISMKPRAIASAFGPILSDAAGKKSSARSSARSACRSLRRRPAAHGARPPASRSPSNAQREGIAAAIRQRGSMPAIARSFRPARSSPGRPTIKTAMAMLGVRIRAEDDQAERQADGRGQEQDAEHRRPRPAQAAPPVDDRQQHGALDHAEDAEDREPRGPARRGAWPRGTALDLDDDRPASDAHAASEPPSQTAANARANVVEAMPSATAGQLVAVAGAETCRPKATGSGSR